jgi:hypothetical protein
LPAQNEIAVGKHFFDRGVEFGCDRAVLRSEIHERYSVSGQCPLINACV